MNDSIDQRNVNERLERAGVVAKSEPGFPLLACAFRLLVYRSETQVLFLTNSIWDAATCSRCQTLISCLSRSQDIFPTLNCAGDHGTTYLLVRWPRVNGLSHEIRFIIGAMWRTMRQYSVSQLWKVHWSTFMWVTYVVSRERQTDKSSVYRVGTLGTIVKNELHTPS